MASKGLTALWHDFKRLKILWPYLRPNKKFIVMAAALVPGISILQVVLPFILKDTIDRGVAEQDHTIWMQGAALFFAANVFLYVCRSGQALSAAVAVHRMILSLRNELIRHVMKLNCSYHDRTLSGTLVTRATSDFDNLSESLNMGVLTSVVDIAVLGGSIAGLFILDWRLALVSVAVLPIVAFLVSWFSGHLKSAMLLARKKIASLNAYTQECLYGSATVKLLNAQEPAGKKFDDYNIQFRDAQMKSVLLDAFMFATIDGVASITTGLVLWFAVAAVTEPETAFTAGILVAFVTYIQQLFEPLKQLGSKIAMLQGAFTSIERIFGVLDRQEFISGHDAVPDVEGCIEFDHVSFSYRGADNEEIPVLKDVHFRVAPGTSLAIVGPTGSGKSTIIKLISKLYDGYRGSVRIDDHDIATFDPYQLRRRIAVVPQDIVLFDGSILFNITLGDPQISEEDAWQAAKTVGAHRFIRRLPGGINASIREQGSNLSQGQKQLISFARALARHPKVIVLDEATSSIDPQSEADIQSAMDRLMKGRTVIVIAHRLATIQKCDQILVIDKGRVVEQGRHQELIDAKGAYAKLYKSGQKTLTEPTPR